MEILYIVIPCFNERDVLPETAEILRAKLARLKENGVIAPDRSFNPHAYEVQYIHQNIWLKNFNLDKGTVEIYNLMGAMVYSQKNCANKVEINTADLQSGIYFIRLMNDKVSETRRFVKE